MAGKGKSMHLYRMLSNDSDSSSDEDDSKKLEYDPKKLIPVHLKPIDVPITHSKDSCLLCFIGFKRRVKWLFRKKFRKSPFAENTLIYIFKAVHKQEGSCKHHSEENSETRELIKKLKQEAQELDDSDQDSTLSSMDESEEKNLIQLK